MQADIQIGHSDQKSKQIKIKQNETKKKNKKKSDSSWNLGGEVSMLCLCTGSECLIHTNDMNTLKPGVLVHVLFLWRDTMNKATLIREIILEACLQFQRASPVSSWQEAWLHAGRHWSSSWELHPDP